VRLAERGGPASADCGLSLHYVMLLTFGRWSAPDIEKRQDMLIALGKDVWRTWPTEVN